MRVYKVIITDNKGKEFLNIQQGTKNFPQTGLNIEFNVEITAASNSTNYLLKIWNLYQYFNNQNSREKLLDGFCQIFAGVANSPLSSKSGIPIQKDPLLLPLFQGYIRGAYPEFNNANNIITLILQTVPDIKTKTPILPFILREGKDYLFDLQKSITSLYQSQGRAAFFVLGERKVKVSETSNSHTYTKITELINFVKNQLQLDLHVSDNNRGTIVTIGTPITQGVTTPITITASELINQPQMTDLNVVAIHVPLTNKYRIFDYIRLPSDTYVDMESYIKVFDPNKQSSITSPNSKSIATFYAGVYRLQKIWHKGQNFNAAVDSWTTTLYGTRIV